MNGAGVFNCDAFTLTVSSSHFRSLSLSLSLLSLDAAPPHGCASLHGALRANSREQEARWFTLAEVFLIFCQVRRRAWRSEETRRSSVLVRDAAAAVWSDLSRSFWCWSLSHFFLDIINSAGAKTGNCEFWQRGCCKPHKTLLYFWICVCACVWRLT